MVIPSIVNMRNTYWSP